MASQQSDIVRAYHRAYKTKLRLEAAIAENKPAYKIAELSQRLEHQRNEYHALRTDKLKI